jgi:hypothetical protein
MARYKISKVRDGFWFLHDHGGDMAVVTICTSWEQALAMMFTSARRAARMGLP